MLSANINNEIQSKIVDIQIHIHAILLASSVRENIITIHKMNNNIHNHNMAHRHCRLFLFDIENTINIIHLINAHRAKIHIIIVHTK
jgi:hypothetical protein